MTKTNRQVVVVQTVDEDTNEVLIEQSRVFERVKEVDACYEYLTEELQEFPEFPTTEPDPALRRGV